MPVLVANWKCDWCQYIVSVTRVTRSRSLNPTLKISFHLYGVWINSFKKVGSGCGSIGRVVASDTSGQSYKQYTLVNYDSMVVICGIFQSGTTLEL